jgi:hypothetical protein
VPRFEIEWLFFAGLQRRLASLHSLSDIFKLDENLDQQAADMERPFVTPIAWALFSAYRTAYAFPVMHWQR